ncbi:Cilia- and flagella-associated protein 251, partial [Blyttiomyces sp. JEL0837]
TFKETYLLTSTTDYKLKLHNAATSLCRKTILGPTFGGLINHLIVVPEADGVPRLVAFATKDRVVGLTKIPLDGNPHRHMGLIAHPCTISKIATSFDGSYLLTAGKEDGIIHMWAIHPEALEAQIALGGANLEPFLNMLDDSGKGAEGPFYREMEDYFYYAQLRSQGEDAATTRQIHETVKLAEVPSIMQAMGFYPSEQEIENLVNEVKYSSIDHGVLVDRVTFGDLIKLFDYTENDLLESLGYTYRSEPGKSVLKNAIRKLEISDTVHKDGLLALLQQYGESMSQEDFEIAFRALLQNDPTYCGNLPEKFTAKQFIEDIMGLQPVVGNIHGFAEAAYGQQGVGIKGNVIGLGLPGEGESSRGSSAGSQGRQGAGVKAVVAHAAEVGA